MLLRVIVKALCMWSHAKITISITTKQKISLLGSHAEKLISQGQNAAIQDLQYFWQILISRHNVDKNQNYGILAQMCCSALDKPKVVRLNGMERRVYSSL